MLIPLPVRQSTTRTISAPKPHADVTIDPHCRSTPAHLIAVHRREVFEEMLLLPQVAPRNGKGSMLGRQGDENEVIPSGCAALNPIEANRHTWRHVHNQSRLTYGAVTSTATATSAWTWMGRTVVTVQHRCWDRRCRRRGRQGAVPSAATTLRSDRRRVALDQASSSLMS